MIKSKIKIDLPEDHSQKGIWRFARFLSPVGESFRLSLNEGNTGEEEITNLILKREDQNPTGSVKDRGMAYLVSKAYENGQKNLVLSSSGNAGISALNYCRLAGIKLFLFVSPNIEKGKKEEIEKLGGELRISRKPLSESIKFAKTNKFFNLRPSTNEFGPEGFQTISFELAKNQGYFEDIFIPVSSGVTLTGIARGFVKLGFMPRIHVCQSSLVHPIAEKFTKEFIEEDQSLARSLVAKTTPLKGEIIDLVKKSGGTGWIIANKEMLEAEEYLKSSNVDTSYEGALCVAAAKKAEKMFGYSKAVCLLTGKKY
ncbi:PLP-dependent lyase/thiolase [Patescibacteria group bacterium]|nr:PLP-dependent lyase/thiolase [Patescibacteria group bacterium]